MAPVVDTDSIATRLKRWAQRFDQHLSELVCPPGEQSGPANGPAGGGAAADLREAMRYAVLGPGKRLRPYLVCSSHVLCGGSESQAYPIAAAAECVHAFSLVHDDLPSMDNDDLRRGRPSTHVKFGEALAILAGDALLTLAFELIATHAPDSKRAAALTLELARAVGLQGMIGGQAADMAGEQLPPERPVIDYIHGRKTARLFESCCRLGAQLADSDPDSLDGLATFGAEFGMAFQITDDILDVTSSAERMGKKVAKDGGAGKQTLVACVGIEESRRVAAAHLDRATEALSRFGARAADLEDLAGFVLERGR